MQVAATAEHVTVVAPGLVALMVVVASASYGLTVKVGVVVRVMLSVVLVPESEAVMRSGVLAAGATTSSTIESSGDPEAGAASVLVARSAATVYT